MSLGWWVFAYAIGAGITLGILVALYEEHGIAEKLTGGMMWFGMIIWPILLPALVAWRVSIVLLRKREDPTDAK